jgi:hypothetical protein
MQFTSMPNELLLNREISNKTKYVYLIIKRRSDGKISYVSFPTLKKVTGISDNRTIINCVKDLKLFGFIDYEEFSSLPKSNVGIKISNYINNFTMIDNEIFDKITDTFKKDAHNAIVLYYSLEMFYNKEYGCACPSREEISNVCKLSNGNITSIISVMHEEMICEFCKGRFIESVNSEFDSVRTRNRYIPNTVKTKNKDDYITKKGEYERRYKKHKPISFFFKNNVYKRGSQSEA